jgi:hypothetical protein
VADESEIAKFIRAYIPSVWALELLLLLRADPDRRWTAAELLKELRASTSLVDENLAHFERHGLALKDEAGWRFAAASPHLEALVAGLAALYRERPMHTIGLIARPDPLQALANAFRIKRDET